MKMTVELLNNEEMIKRDAERLHQIGACYDSMGVSENFLKYFDENYEYDTEEDTFCGIVFNHKTEEQKEIYDKYTYLVAEKLFTLNHERR